MRYLFILFALFLVGCATERTEYYQGCYDGLGFVVFTQQYPNEAQQKWEKYREERCTSLDNEREKEKQRKRELHDHGHSF